MTVIHNHKYEDLRTGDTVHFVNGSFHKRCEAGIVTEKIFKDDSGVTHKDALSISSILGRTLNLRGPTTYKEFTTLNVDNGELPEGYTWHYKCCCGRES